MPDTVRKIYSASSHPSGRLAPDKGLENPDILEQLRVNKYDRTYQIWKREPLSIELFTEKAFMQKLEYIHENPVTAALVNFAEEYKYSFPKSSGQAAKFYLEGIDVFDMITHYTGN